MPTPKELFKRRVLSCSEKDLVQCEDGMYVYWPDVFNGAHTAESLRVIADELDRLNAPLVAELNKYADGV